MWKTDDCDCVQPVLYQKADTVRKGESCQVLFNYWIYRKTTATKHLITFGWLSK